MFVVWREKKKVQVGALRIMYYGYWGGYLHLARSAMACTGLHGIPRKRTHQKKTALANDRSSTVDISIIADTPLILQALYLL